MAKVILRKSNRQKRNLKIRANIKGIASVPRLSVFRSNKYIYAQLIDDQKGRTLVDTFAETKELHKKLTKVLGAQKVGEILAQKALKKHIKKAVFDRKGYKFHGRVKALAEAARNAGLKI